MKTIRRIAKKILTDQSSWSEVKPVQVFNISHKPINASYDSTQNSQQVLHFKNVILWPSQSVVKAGNTKVEQTVFDAQRRDKVDKELVLYPKGQTIEHATSIDFLWSGNNHFHQLIDCNSRLFALRQITPIRGLKLLLPHENTRRYESIIMELCPWLTILPCKPNRRYPCANYYHLPTISIPKIGGKKIGLGQFSALSKIYLQFHQSYALDLHPPQIYEKIYVSRRKANHRRVLNEVQLVSFLKKSGFVEILPEEHSIEHQLHLFRQAKIIVMPHGAAMSNLLACDGQTLYIELLPCSKENSADYFGGKMPTFRHVIIESDEQNLHSDFSVNIEQLQAVLQKNKLHDPK